MHTLILLYQMHSFPFWCMQISKCNHIVTLFLLVTSSLKKCTSFIFLLIDFCTILIEKCLHYNPTKKISSQNRSIVILMFCYKTIFLNRFFYPKKNVQIGMPVGKSFKLFINTKRTKTCAKLKGHSINPQRALSTFVISIQFTQCISNQILHDIPKVRNFFQFLHVIASSKNIWFIISVLTETEVLWRIYEMRLILWTKRDATLPYAAIWPTVWMCICQ